MLPADDPPVDPLDPPVDPGLPVEPEPLMPPLLAELPRPSSFWLPRSVRLPVEPELPGLLLDPPVLLLSGLLPDAP